MINAIPVDLLTTILALVVALAFLVRREPWAVLVILARRLTSVGSPAVSVTFRDRRRPSGR